MLKFKPSILSLALVAAGASMSSYAAEEAATEQTADENIEVMNVTGIRRSLQESQSLKMSSSSVIEAISAEDIGKLPDVSIAESLARLPGIAAQRLDGRANVVSVRGLGPDFTTATLNGREQVTVNDNRSVEFDQYPSELLNRVVVYKTPDASVMAQGVGGSIDMQTIRPLNHGKQTVAIGLRGEHNDLGALNSDSNENGYRASVAYIDQFADDTIGFAFGYARMQSPNQEERWNAWGYPSFDGTENSPLVLGGAKPYVRSSELIRDGYMGVIEFQPNDNLHSIIDVYYSKFSDEQTLRGIEIPGAWGGGWANDGITASEVENGLVTKGVINNAAVIIRNDINRRDADTLSIGFNNTFNLNDNFSVTADISYSKAERTDFGLETYSGTGRGNGVGATDDIEFELRGDGRYTFTSPNLDYSDPNLIKLGGAFSWGEPVGPSSQDGFINMPEIEDELAAMRLSAEYVFDSGVFSSVDFGVNYTDRDKSKRDVGVFLTVDGYPDMVDVPSQYMLAPTSLDFFGMGNMLSYDAWALYQSGFYTETSDAGTDITRANNSWDVYEKVTTAYVKGNLDTEVFDLALTGNIGLQAVHTDQSSDGQVMSQDKKGNVILTPNNDGTTYTEWLPSFNLNLEIADGQQLRLAAARTLSRNKMDDMNANVNFSYNEANQEGKKWSGYNGNPHLKPWMARQYDLSYENYFGDSSYFALAAFWKDLENYTYDQQVEYDFKDITLPDGQIPSEIVGLITSPQNGEGGYVRGIEATFSLSAGEYIDALDGFGAVLSGAYNESKVKETPDSDPTALPGLSEKIFNAAVYYENYGFSTRVSARYRSDFLGEVTALSLTRQLVTIQGETLVDAQIGYDFAEAGIKALEGLSVQLQVTNLTNQEFVTYVDGDERLVRDYQNYGRNYMLGAIYKF